MNEYFTIDMFGTGAGMVAAVTLIVQFFKGPIDRIRKVRTRYIVWAIALVLQIVYQCAILQDYSFKEFFLSFFNSIVVALGSMGAYDVTFATGDRIKCECACEVIDKSKPD